MNRYRDQALRDYPGEQAKGAYTELPRSAYIENVDAVAQ